MLWSRSGQTQDAVLLQHCNYITSTPFFRHRQRPCKYWTLALRGAKRAVALASVADVDVVLALDAGTSSIRTVAFSRDGGEVASAQRELTQYFPSPGHVEHDGAEIAALAVATLREVASNLDERDHRVVALGITNQRETTVAFDRDDGQLVHRALVWQDRRTAARCDELRLAGHEMRVRRTTGLVLDPYFSATKMGWLVERGYLDHARAPALSTVDGWLLWWLTGNRDGGVFATEASNASRTQLMDLDTLDWSLAMCALFGVARDLLPVICPSAYAFGTVSASVVPELAGVPIAAMLGDQQAALFGQACFEPGDVKATYGTGAFVMANVGDQIPEPVDGLLTTVAWDLGSFGSRAYALEGSAFVAGAAVQWLRDELGFVDAAHDLEPLARRVPDAGGVVVIPAFTGLGSPFWRPDARGAILGLSQSTRRPHIARALIESLAHQVRAMTDAFVASGVALGELRADGGAARMDLLLELQATDSDVTVVRSASIEATARGAATLAGLATGFWASLDELREHWRAQRTFGPSARQTLDASYAAWRRAIDRGV